MSAETNMENRLRELGRAIGGDDSLSGSVMARIHAEPAPLAAHSAASRIQLRRWVANRVVRFAAAAAVLVAIGTLASILGRSGSRVYAVEQTVKALCGVRYMHTVQRDQAGNLKDERWIEIDSNGYQARYRQDTPSDSFFVVDNRKTVMVHYASPDRNTVVLYDPNQQGYTWYYNPGKLFRELAEGGSHYYTVEENVQYKGRPAHHLRWVVGNMDVYIDPSTKLPLAFGDYEISYGEPPEGTFDIIVPEGVIRVDKRPGGEPAAEPQWMIDARKQEELNSIAAGHISDARRALAAGDYAKAIELFTKGLEIRSKSNWAWLWLGKALYGAGDYDQAIYRLSTAIDMITEFGAYHLARGFAYQAKGMTDMARLDMEKALPEMIRGLRSTEAAYPFDLADDPLIRADGLRGSEGHLPPGRERSLALMINRLRLVTGRNFGYDPNGSAEENERAISAWEQWFKRGGQIRYTPDARLIPVPSSFPAGQLSPAIDELPWTGTGEQALAMFKKAREITLSDVDAWFKLGLTLYDGRFYPESLEAFRQAHMQSEDDSLDAFGALVWQGHIMDLLGRRNDALLFYRRALDMDAGGQMLHDQYGLTVDRAWVKKRLQTPFVRAP